MISTYPEAMAILTAMPSAAHDHHDAEHRSEAHDHGSAQHHGEAQYRSEAHDRGDAQQYRDAQDHDDASVQCISPYLNPAHVLAPPRAWLESVLEGRTSWQFFRVRYKDLLRHRFQKDPDSFFALLDEAQHGRKLVLTCHCLAGPCHTEVANDFLNRLRDQEPYRRWMDLRRQVTLFPLPMHHAGTVTH
jgi:hypothetical protein